MSKLFKKVALSVLCAILLACTVTVGTILGLNSRANKIDGLADDNGGKHTAADTVTITPDNFDKEYVLDGANCTDQAAIWAEAIKYSKDNGKTVRLNLKTDWTATGNSSATSFGTDTGAGTSFTTNITGNSLTSGSGYAGSILVPSGAKVILNLNGHTIDRGTPAHQALSIGGAIYVMGTLEVRDDSFQYDTNGYDKGVIKGGQSGYGGAIGVAAGATLTVNGGTFTLNAASVAGGAIYSHSSMANITVNGGYFINNGAVKYGGAIFTNGTLTVNNGTFKGNYQNSTVSESAMSTGGNGLCGGGALSSSPSGTINIYGGLFDGNYANCFGGAITCYGDGTNSSTLNITGGTFTNNEALSTGMGNGAVIYCDGPTTVNISGGVFSHNKAYFTGGVITTYGYLNGKSTNLTISGGEFFNNQACAGSVYFSYAGYLNMSGGYMHDNIASLAPINSSSRWTGAIFLDGTNSTTANGFASAKFSGGKIVNNVGGGVYTSKSTGIELCGPLIVRDNAQYNFYLVKQNFTTNAIASGDTYFYVTDKLIKNGQAADIGVSMGAAGGITDQIPSGKTAFVTQNYGNVYPLTTSPQATFICEPYAGTFFISDNSNVYSGMNNTECCFGNGSGGSIKKIALTWTYKVNGGSPITATSNNIRINYGDKITEVTASWSGTRPDNSAASVSMTWTESGGVTSTGLERPANSILVQDKSGSVFNKIEDVGCYSFFIDAGEPFFFNAANTWMFGDNTIFNVEVVPKDVTVTIDDTNSVYGDAINLTSNADTVAAGLNVQLARDSATSSVGKYKVYGTWNNPSYNVTFVNAAGDKAFGVHEITVLPVTIVLNDDWSEYGIKFYNLNKDKNANAEQAVGAITQGTDNLYYDSEGHLVDGDGIANTAYRIDDNGNKIYKGGWRYGASSKEFYANDMTVATHKYPFELSLTYKKPDNTVVDLTNSGNTDVIPRGAYDIIAKKVNKNYDITFENSDASDTKAVFTLKGATLKVDKPTATSTYIKSTYDNTDKGTSIQLPTTEIKGIGGAAVTTATVKYYNQVGTATTPVNPAPNEKTTTGWQTNVPTGNVKNAGEYTIYCLITEPNYEDLVYPMTYTVEQQELKFTLKVKHGSTDVNKTNGAYKVTYDDTKAVTVTVSYVGAPSYLSTDVANSLGPDYKVYYKGNGANGNNYGTASDPTYKDDSGNDKDGNPLNKGNSNGPKEGGVYTASLVNKTGSSSNYKLVPDTNASDSVNFEIEAKPVALPVVGKGTDADSTGTYNGKTQTITYQYETAAIKTLTSTNYTSVSEIVDGDAVVYEDLTFSASNDNTSTKKTTASFTATNAGTYAVKFELANTRNYKWNDTENPTGVQIVKSTIAKAALDLTLVSPATGGGWQWEADQTGDITASAVTGVIGSDAVTFDVSWYKYDPDASGDPTLTTVQNGKAYDEIKLDVTALSTEATYYLVIQLDTTNTVNSNYTLPDKDNNFTPKLEGIKLKEIGVGAGKVNTSNIEWQYKLTASGSDADYLVNQTDPDDNTKLEYTAVYNTVTEAWEAKQFILTVKSTSLPAYLEIDTTYNSDGYTNGYKDNAKTDADTYTAYVRLNVKSGSSYTFADGSTSGSASFSWTINKKELKFKDTNGDSLITWAFSTDAKTTAGGEQDPNATWTEFSDSAKPAYTEARIYVKISDDWFEGLGLDTDASQLEVKYNQTNFQTAAKTKKTTQYTVTLKGDNAKNYAIATGENTGTFEWEIGYAQIKVTGWGGTRDVYDDKTEKSFTLPAVDVPAELEGKIEYTYSYDILDEDKNVIGHKDDVDEATMIADLYPVTDETHPNNTLKIKPVVKSGESFDIVFESGVNDEESATIGEMKTSVTVEVIGSGSQYGSVKFEVKATYYPDNDTNLSFKDFLENYGQHLKITVTGPEGNTAEMTAKDLANAFTVLTDAGTYTVRFEITDADTKAEFALKKSKFEFVVAPKEIAVPQITGEIVFEGKSIDLKTKLDANYIEYSDKEIVQWTVYDTDCYHVGTYNATLTIVNANYVWADSADTESQTKVLARYTVVDNVIEANDKINANYSWEIKPFVLSGDKLWNTSGKAGASLNLPEWVAALMEGENPTLGVEYSYRTDKASPAVEPEWKGGNAYFVSATLNGADANDFVFANNTQTSDMVSYTVPQSGAAAFFSNVGSFVKNNWLWFVIGGAILLLLILLIIIIAVARKKKKKKAEEEAKKAEKEEAKAAAAATAAAPMLAMSASMADEKAKLEAEKAKMEAELAKAKMEAEAEAARAKAQMEAEAAKAKAQAELDLQKAKMEAEIAKMRAEAEAQAKQAQVQQPAQQPAPQPAQQPQYAQSQYQQQPQSMPQPQFMPQPQYMPQPQADNGALARLEEEFRSMRAEQRSDTKLENEMLKLRLDMNQNMQGNRYGYNPNQLPAGQQPALSDSDINSFAEKLGILMASMMRNMGVKSMPAPEKNEPQVIEAESQPVAVNTPTIYPPDAVITTTTRVDTTSRAKPVSGGDRGDDSIFDIDGFYDKFDESK
ncbi:MAG: hypothetical protein K2K60_01730 [Clostridia bacterium]|nr:hypothetical protein [Clostridia bacterium]